jgi:hypothetical protein
MPKAASNHTPAKAVEQPLFDLRLAANLVAHMASSTRPATGIELEHVAAILEDVYVNPLGGIVLCRRSMKLGRRVLANSESGTALHHAGITEARRGVGQGLYLLERDVT